MLTYTQSHGIISLDGIIIGVGYSGHGIGLNNPELETATAIGPIPRGLYRVGVPRDRKNTGRYSMSLTPVNHNALGRSGFFAHGDNTKGDKSASHGCIVAAYPTRFQMWTDNHDCLLRVIR